jgi:hypothetical protein
MPPALSALLREQAVCQTRQALQPYAPARRTAARKAPPTRQPSRACRSLHAATRLQCGTKPEARCRRGISADPRATVKRASGAQRGVGRHGADRSGCNRSPASMEWQAGCAPSHTLCGRAVAASPCMPGARAWPSPRPPRAGRPALACQGRPGLTSAALLRQGPAALERVWPRSHNGGFPTHFLPAAFCVGNVCVSGCLLPC